jgi:hypothetical protein
MEKQRRAKFEKYLYGGIPDVASKPRTVGESLWLKLKYKQNPTLTELGDWQALERQSAGETLPPDKKFDPYRPLWDELKDINEDVDLEKSTGELALDSAKKAKINRQKRGIELDLQKEYGLTPEEFSKIVKPSEE